MFDQTLHAVARGLSQRVRLGTSSWSFPGWRGIIWEGATTTAALAKDGLRVYAQHPLLRTVGVDKTYYRPAPAEEFARLRAQVTDDFRFLVKAHESLMRRETAATSERGPAHFLDAAFAQDQVIEPITEGLGVSAGPILFQFSPMGLRTAAHAEAFIRKLGAFLGALPQGPLYTIEVRDRVLLRPSWPAMLHDHGATHCFSVHPAMPTPAIQGRTVDPATQRAIVSRWMLHSGLAYATAVDRYHPFDKIVDPDPASREQFAQLCALAIAQGKDAWVIINNKAEGCAPRSVERLARAIADAADGADGAVSAQPPIEDHRPHQDHHP